MGTPRRRASSTIRVLLQVTRGAQSRCPPFAAELAGELSEGLKSFQVVGAAVGIARVVDGIDTQHQAVGVASFRQAQPMAMKTVLRPGT